MVDQSHHEIGLRNSDPKAEKITFWTLFGYIIYTLQIFADFHGFFAAYDARKWQRCSVDLPARQLGNHLGGRSGSQPEGRW